VSGHIERGKGEGGKRKIERERENKRKRERERKRYGIFPLLESVHSIHSQPPVF